MKINFDSKILDFNEKPLKENINGKTVDSDLKFYSILALTANSKDPSKQLGGIEKVKRFTLAQKINCGGEIELTVEEISLIKQLIGEIFIVLVVGRCYELLDPKEKEIPKK